MSDPKTMQGGFDSGQNAGFFDGPPTRNLAHARDVHLPTREGATETEMGRGLLLWLLGIPLPIILVIWLLGGLS